MTAQTPPRNLAEILDQDRRTKVEAAGRTIERLTAHAHGLGMSETSARLDEIGGLLASDAFQIIVAGRFKNGKSTLLNALIGSIDGDSVGLARAPLPTDVLPCTAVLATICYATKPYVKAWRHDESSEEWSLRQFADESMIEHDEAENVRKFKDIRNFEVGLPVKLCKSGVILIDSPGIDDVSSRTEITRDAVRCADAAIVVLKTDALAGQREIEFINELMSTRTRVFFVVNRFHGVEVTGKMKGFVWQRLVADLQGKDQYAGQSFEEEDIFFVNALQAEEGRLLGEQKLVDESGLTRLESRLGEFLVNDRHFVHLERFTHAATREGVAIERHISQKRAILLRESKDLDNAAEEIRPKLDELRRRREKVPEILGRYRREATRTLGNSFEEIFSGLRRSIRWELEARPLPSLESWKGKAVATVRPQKVVKEAEVAFQTIVDEAVASWVNAPQGKLGARDLLEPIIMRMNAELTQEVGEIEKGFHEIRWYLTGGWKHESTELDDTVTLTQKFLAVVAGVLLQNIGIAIGGSVGGPRAALISAGGTFATAAGLGLLAAVGVPITWPLFLGATVVAGIVGGLGGNLVGMEQRVKRRVVEALEPRLDNVESEAREDLEKQIGLLFQKIEDEGMKELRSSIEAEEQDIRSMLEANAQSREEKVKMLGELEAVGHQVQDDLRVLRQLGVEVAQVA